MSSRAAISRRRFLGLVGVVAIASIVAAWLPTQWARQLVARARDWYRARTDPELPRTAPGPLSPRTLEVVQTTTARLVDTPVELSHYTRYFEFRAENLPGYREVYERFAQTLDAAAKRASHVGFVECPPAVQLRVLENTVPTPGPVGALIGGMFDRTPQLFHKYVVREILALFVRTDAWVLLGYEAWPGKPRGLERYTRPPETPVKAA